MQALKALVIALGVLILVAAGVIAVTIYKRATNGIEDAGAGAAGFGNKELALPAGAVLEDMTASGKHLVLRLRLADGSPRIMVIDLATGEPLGELDFAVQP